MGVSSSRFHDYAAGRFTKEQIGRLAVGSSDAGSVNRHLSKLADIVKACGNVWRSGPLGRPSADKIESFFEKKAEQLKRENEGKKREDRKGKTVLQSYFDSLKWAERQLGLAPITQDLQWAQQLVQESQSLLNNRPKRATPLQQVDMVNLEKLVVRNQITKTKRIHHIKTKPSI